MNLFVYHLVYHEQKVMMGLILVLVIFVILIESYYLKQNIYGLRELLLMMNKNMFDNSFYMMQTFLLFHMYPGLLFWLVSRRISNKVQMHFYQQKSCFIITRKLLLLNISLLQNCMKKAMLIFIHVIVNCDFLYLR